MQSGIPALGEHRADAGAVAFPHALELGERLEARSAHRQLDARVGEPSLGLGQPTRLVHLQRLEPLALLLQCDELGGDPVARDGQRGLLRSEPLGLHSRLGELGRESFGAAPQLDLALTQLAGAPHEVDALGGEPRLLETQRFGVIALQREGRALAREGGLEFRRRARPLGSELLRVAECPADALALADDRRLALRGRPNLLVEAHALLAELADLDAHLLTTLQEPLELSLHLRDRLAEVRQTMLALLEGFPRPGLTRRQGRQTRSQLLLVVPQAHELAGQALALGGASRVVRGDQRQPQVTLLRLEHLVLLRLLGLPLE